MPRDPQSIQGYGDVSIPRRKQFMQAYGEVRNPVVASGGRRFNRARIHLASLPPVPEPIITAAANLTQPQQSIRGTGDVIDVELQAVAEWLAMVI